jgi:magnesium transporter
MNLEILPSAVAVPVVLVAMAAIPTAMFLMFKRKRWL